MRKVLISFLLSTTYFAGQKELLSFFFFERQVSAFWVLLAKLKTFLFSFQHFHSHILLTSFGAENTHGMILFDILSISGTTLVMKQYITALPAGRMSSTVI